MNDEYIELLKMQLVELKNIDVIQSGYYRSSSVDGWISGTISFLEQKFDKKSFKIRDLENIKYSKIDSLYGESYYEIKTVNNIAEPILRSCIDLLEKKVSKNNIKENGKTEAPNFTIIQQQTNSQNINLEVITKVLQNELDETQLKEMQSILDSLEPKENKKIKLSEKLKGFGIDILSNVISGFLTNTLQ